MVTASPTSNQAEASFVGAPPPTETSPLVPIAFAFTRTRSMSRAASSW